MKVAIFGCLHGMLDAMYEKIAAYEYSNSLKIELVIVCGDCQTIRHEDDLACLSVPMRYKKIGDFYKYYSGEKKIPKLTIFVGGNHEASNYLMTLPYGGWVCENFYYMGYAGVVRYKNLRIAGVSGIFNFHNCKRGRFERMPLDDKTMRSVYHTRRLEIFRLQLLRERAEAKDPLDVFISHDWPRGIYNYGNLPQLLRFKPDFTRDVRSKNGLGNPLTEPLVEQLKPRRWFAAHLHCRFDAKVNHGNDGKCTEFLSLNKIENNRNFMEVLDMTNSRDLDDSDNNLYYDVEWLTILRKTKHLESDSMSDVSCPNLDDGSGRSYLTTEEDLAETVEMMNNSGGMKIENNFRMVEPVIYNRSGQLPISLDTQRVRFYPNHQTEDLTQRLQLDRLSNVKCEMKVEPSKTEVASFEESRPSVNPPAKKRAVSKGGNDAVELDEDGCLPFFVDTRGER